MSGLRFAWLIALAYALLYAVLGAVRYATFHAGSDLGLFTQAIASAAAGMRDTPEGGSHFTYHFSPVLALFAPPLLAFHSPLVLVAIQALAGALVVPPLYLIARRRFSERLALGVGALAAVYPPLAGVTFADFHENGLVPAATVWLLWAVDARRWGWAAAALAIVLSIKEDQAPIVGFAALCGLAFYARRRDRVGLQFCAAALVAAAAVFVLFFGVVRPLAGARGGWSPEHFYNWGGRDTGATPWYSIGRPAYVLEALVPLAFACCVSPAFVLALPGFAEDVLSHDSITYTMGQHYAAVWIPYLLFAWVLGVARLHARNPAVARKFVRAAWALSLAILVCASPTHWGHYLRLPNRHDAELAHFLARLPPELAVGTSDDLFAHLGFDPNAQLGLERDPPYALFAQPSQSALALRWLPVVERGVADGRYRVVRERDGIALYERESAAGGRRSSAPGRRAPYGRVVVCGRGHEQECGQDGRRAGLARGACARGCAPGARFERARR